MRQITLELFDKLLREEEREKNHCQGMKLNHFLLITIKFIFRFFFYGKFLIAPLL